MKDLVEIEEWYRGGQVVRRYINGTEVAADTEPVAIQFCESVTTKTYMTSAEFKEKYGDFFTKSNASTEGAPKESN